MSNPVLITRAPPKAQQFKDQLAQAGISNIHISPVMKISPIPVQIPDFDAALFTSGHAISGLDPNFDPKGRPAFCVGQRTTQLAADRGFAAQMAGTTAVSMVQNIPQNPPRLLYIRGVHVSFDLRAALQPLGRHVAEVITYDQRPVALTKDAKKLIQRGTPVVLPLFSALSAKYLLERIGHPVRHTCVCISPKVAEICATYGANCVEIAQTPDAKAMVHAVGRALAAH